MRDKTMNWTAPVGWTPIYGDYISGQGATNGGEGAKDAGFGYKNDALRIRFHLPTFEQSEFYVATPEVKTHLSCCALVAVEWS